MTAVLSVAKIEVGVDSSARAPSWVTPAADSCDVLFAGGASLSRLSAASRYTGLQRYPDRQPVHHERVGAPATNRQPLRLYQFGQGAAQAASASDRLLWTGWYREWSGAVGGPSRTTGRTHRDRFSLR